jgi:CheY-like chemotaxis protein
MATEAHPATQAKRILVVEDELIIRMLLEDMLGELGYTVAAEAARMDEALEATKNADFDLAILDANLNGQPISPVADALVARGTPFVFATGYGENAAEHIWIAADYRRYLFPSCGQSWRRSAESPPSEDS